MGEVGGRVCYLDNWERKGDAQKPTRPCSSVIFPISGPKVKPAFVFCLSCGKGTCRVTYPRQKSESVVDTGFPCKLAVLEVELEVCAPASVPATQVEALIEAGSLATSLLCPVPHLPLWKGSSLTLLLLFLPAAAYIAC